MKMTYKIRKRKKKIPETYFRERELREIRKRHKGHLPFTEVIKEGHRFVAKYPRATHKVNHSVLYNNKEYVVRKVSKKGVYLSRIKKSDSLLEGVKLTKPIFVPEKKYSGRAVPFGMFWVFAPA